jgi:hypothetical protein
MTATPTVSNRTELVEVGRTPRARATRTEPSQVGTRRAGPAAQQIRPIRQPQQRVRRTIGRRRSWAVSGMSPMRRRAVSMTVVVMAVHAWVRGREDLAAVGKVHQPTCRVRRMTGRALAMTVRAYGYEARFDGLGNARARLWHRHRDGARTGRWADAPTDSFALLGRLTHSGVR